MIRLTFFTAMTVMTFAGIADPALATEPPGHARKPAKTRTVPQRSDPSAPPHSINAPSADFSKIERSDDGSGGPDGPTFHPTMGAGGMGLGGSF